MSKDSQMRAAINQKLIEMGERERLKELLRAKLVECGWKDQLTACFLSSFKNVTVFRWRLQISPLDCRSLVTFCHFFYMYIFF
uniref:Transcription and mRNA export factor ENY2-2-like n=1 Tax=Myripristis murdjan TaxID=586833 RepID=A0A667XH13_9TELE